MELLKQDGGKSYMERVDISLLYKNIGEWHLFQWGSNTWCGAVRRPQPFDGVFQYLAVVILSGCHDFFKNLSGIPFRQVLEYMSTYIIVFGGQGRDLRFILADDEGGEPAKRREAFGDHEKNFSPPALRVNGDSLCLFLAFMYCKYHGAKFFPMAVEDSGVLAMFQDSNDTLMTGEEALVSVRRKLIECGQTGR